MSRHLRHFPETDPLPLNPKQDEREAIQGHVDAFLSGGGEIQQIEYGCSGEDPGPKGFIEHVRHKRRLDWIVSQDKRSANKK